MNYEKFFKKEETKKELGTDIHNELLKKLLVYGMEEKEEDFNNLLKNKNFSLNLLSEAFSFDVTYELDGSGNEISINPYDNYTSFINAAITCLSSKYMEILIKNITENDIEKARKKNPNNLSMELIRDCVKFGRYEVLDQLKDKKLISDNAILQTMFVYAHYDLNKIINEEAKQDASNVHQIIKTIRGSNYKTSNIKFLAEDEEDNTDYVSMKPNENTSFLLTKGMNNRVGYGLVKSLEQSNIMGYEKREELYQDTLKLIRTELKISNPTKLIDKIGQYDQEYQNIKIILKIFVINGQLDFDSTITREDLPILKKEITIQELCEFTKKEEEYICKARFEKMSLCLEKEDANKDKTSIKRIKI